MFVACQAPPENRSELLGVSGALWIHGIYRQDRMGKYIADVSSTSSLWRWCTASLLVTAYADFSKKM